VGLNADRLTRWSSRRPALVITGWFVALVCAGAIVVSLLGPALEGDEDAEAARV